MLPDKGFLTEGFLTIIMLMINEYYRLKIHFHVRIHSLGISIFQDDVPLNLYRSKDGSLYLNILIFINLWTLFFIINQAWHFNLV